MYVINEVGLGVVQSIVQQIFILKQLRQHESTRRCAFGTYALPIYIER